MAIKRISNYLAERPVKNIPGSGDTFPISDADDNDEVKITSVAINPSRLILVDGRYTDNVNPRFDNIEDALTSARTLNASPSMPVVVNGFCDASGEPINLGSNDYYALRAEGIYFVSDFDVWKDYVINGGVLNQSAMLYNVDQNKLVIEIKG